MGGVCPGAVPLATVVHPSGAAGLGVPLGRLGRVVSNSE